MKTSKIVVTIGLTVLALIMSACTADDTTGEYRDTKVAINVACIANPTAAEIDSYVTTLTGDTITQDETGTTIDVILDSNGVKKVCIDSGSAHIVRSVLY